MNFLKRNDLVLAKDRFKRIKNKSKAHKNILSAIKPRKVTFQTQSSIYLFIENRDRRKKSKKKLKKRHQNTKRKPPSAILLTNIQLKFKAQRLDLKRFHA